MAIDRKVKYEELEQYDNLHTNVMDDLGRKYAFLIGKFLLSFIYLEHLLDIEVANIINSRTHEPGYTVIKNLTYNQKVELLKSLIKPAIFYSRRAKKKKLERLDFVVNGLKDMGELRNKIAHANWYSLDSDGYVRVKIKTDKEGLIKLEKFQIKPLLFNNGLIRMNKVSRKLQEIWEIVHED